MDVFVDKGNGVLVGVAVDSFVDIVVEVIDGLDEHAAKIIAKITITVFDFIFFP